MFHIHFSANHETADGHTGVYSQFTSSIIYLSKSGSNKEDYSTWWGAMKDPFDNEYCKAACKKIQTLEEINAWEFFDRPDGNNVIEFTWEFKMK